MCHQLITFNISHKITYPQFPPTLFWVVHSLGNSQHLMQWLTRFDGIINNTNVHTKVKAPQQQIDVDSVVLQFFIPQLCPCDNGALDRIEQSLLFANEPIDVQRARDTDDEVSNTKGTNNAPSRAEFIHNGRGK